MKIIPFTSHHKAAHTPKPGQIPLLSMIGNDPFVDWLLIFASTLFIAIVLICIGGYMYFDTEDQLSGSSQISNQSAAIRFDAAKLRSVISQFDDRAAETLMLGKGYQAPRDPSLP